MQLLNKIKLKSNAATIIMLVALLMTPSISLAQKKQKYDNLYDTTRVDSAFGLTMLTQVSYPSIVHKNFYPTRALTMSWKTFKAHRMINEIKISETTHYYNYRSIIYKLKRSHKRLHKHLKNNRISLKKLQFDSTKIIMLDTSTAFKKYGKSIHYARVTHYAHVGSKQKVQIHYLAMRILGAWYIMDELELESWRIKKKKKRKF